MSPWHPPEGPMYERLAGCLGLQYYAWWPWHSHRFCAPGDGWGGCAPCLLREDPQGRSCLPPLGQRRGASGAPCACSEPWSSAPEKGKAAVLMCYAVAQEQAKESHVRPERASVESTLKQYVLTNSWLNYKNYLVCCSPGPGDLKHWMKPFRWVLDITAQSTVVSGHHSHIMYKVWIESPPNWL